MKGVMGRGNCKVKNPEVGPNLGGRGQGVIGTGRRPRAGWGSTG